MKRKRNWLLIIVVLLAGCKPIIVDPPEPPVLTIRQRQKALMEQYKQTGHMPRGGYYVLVADPNL